MNTFLLLKHPMVALPALAMTFSMAVADDMDCECPGESTREHVEASAANEQEALRENASASNLASVAAQTRAAADAALVHPHYLANKPALGYFSNDLIGHEVMNRRDNKKVGTVDELLIDADGRIDAVVINTGGLMGIGVKVLAISWSEFERRIDGEDITLSIDVTPASLAEAPAFARK